ncbi:MAG: hypothetical protein ACFFA8_03895 [Promethearchaeota archaeon]
MFILVQTFDVPRFIQVFIVQGLIGFVYLFVAFKILRREKKGINFTLSVFYICGGVGVTINIIYSLILNETIVYVLYFLTYYILCLSLIFLLTFVLLVLKSEKIITIRRRFMIIFIFGASIFGVWFIPNGITINDTTNWKPVWSWPFFIYSILICTFIAIGPAIYFSIKIYNKFKHEELKKKWRYFLIGIFAYFFLYYGTSLSNTLANQTFRLIWSLISLPTLISLYFIYHGVAKKL